MQINNTWLTPLDERLCKHDGGRCVQTYVRAPILLPDVQLPDVHVAATQGLWLVYLEELYFPVSFSGA